jgi:hypothetical protein
VPHMRTVGSEQIAHRVHGSSAYDHPHIDWECIPRVTIMGLVITECTRCNASDRHDDDKLYRVPPGIRGVVPRNHIA